MYQNFDAKLNRECLMVLRPSAALRKKVQGVFHGGAGHVPHWSNFVTVVVSTLATGWVEYARFLDLRVWDIVC